LTFDDPIAGDLFGPNNLIAGDTSFRGGSDLGIVVTEKLLKRLGYDRSARFIYFDDNDKDVLNEGKSNFKVPIPIRAVIKNIPNRNNFLVTKFFYLSYMAHEDCVFDYNFQKKRVIFYIDADKDFAKKIQENIKANIGELSGGLSTEDITIEYEKYDNMPKPGYALSVSFNTAPEEAIVSEKLARHIEEMNLVKENNNKIFRIFDLDIAQQQPENVIYDYLSINFNKLDKIEDFSKFIIKNLNSASVKSENSIVEVDAGIVKEKNNFNYMSKMTLLISSLLIAFSILSILLFISNLLKKHLNKVKPNLGTFKAFGLSDKESKGIYMTIMLRFIFISMTISLALSYIIGKVAEMGFASQLKIEDQADYFNLFDMRTYGVIITIVLVTVIVSYYNVNKILSKTPGDLIYNR
ncbi:MAG: ABC transporter permease, partial [Bacteroidota bacterium]